ncbi:MAG: hypothetical protein II735_04885 [Clostridia bacterium]|nr:hypothetical protein [Clostridia bacterium]
MCSLTKALEICSFIAIIFGARSIDGRFKTLSKHAAGIILSDSKDISDYIPVCYDTHEKMLMAQCGNKSVESVYGLLKMDLLSLPTLDVISAILTSIAKAEKITIDFSAIPEEYEVFRDVFFDGHTDFIFQFGSSGMQEQLKRTHPMNIKELMLINAAYRPGTIKCLDIISDVLMDKKPVEYLTPLLAPILKETCGCIIYQEQVMQIFTDVAGYTPEAADKIRSAISKKNKDVITAEHDNFVRGCMNKGISKEVADTLMDVLCCWSVFYLFIKSEYRL